MNEQIKEVQKAKNSAFKVLLETKKKLEKACLQARTFIDLNDDEVKALAVEVTTLHETNTELNKELAQMQKSISETNKILGE